MAFRIGGFAAEHKEKKQESHMMETRVQSAPKKSVVQVYFAESGRKLVYFNDLFDLHLRMVSAKSLILIDNRQGRWYDMPIKAAEEPDYIKRKCYSWMSRS